MNIAIRWSSFILLGLLLQACASTIRPDNLAPRPDGVVDLGAQAIPACHEVGPNPEKTLCVFAPREEAGRDEHKFRTEVAGEPDWSKDQNAIGVALSGGGTRAAANAMGVLAGLDDLGLLTHVKPGNKKKVELISSVSGGGYAAYFLYSHLLHPAEIPVERGELFQDCVTQFEADEQGKTETFALTKLTAKVAAYMCTKDTYALNATSTQHAWEGDGKVKQSRHQAMIRCQQDVLQPTECSFQVTSDDRLSTAAHLVVMAGASLLTAPIHHVANSLFDWGVNLSPTRAAYVNGINLTYGGLIAPAFRPSFRSSGNVVTKAYISCSSAVTPNTSGTANYNLFECDEKAAQTQPKPWTLSEFSDRLMSKRKEQEAASRTINGQEAYRTIRNHPYWVIQATSAPTRGLLGWFQKGVNKPDIFNNSFEFTPTHFGSRRYGFLPGTPANTEVIDAVVSAAAFLDSNQQLIDGAISRPFVAALLHAGNANWGIDIANYNTSPVRRFIHRATPILLNTLDATGTWLGQEGARRERLQSTFIRLTDGGNTENLALYAQIRRGIKDIVISDGAADAKGLFGDLCHVKRSLIDPSDKRSTAAVHDATQKPLFLYLPGLDNFEELCLLPERNGRSGGYDLTNWQHELPVLLGCIHTEAAPISADQCSAAAAQSGKVVSRLYIYKPALTPGAKKAGEESVIKSCKVIDYVAESGPISRLLSADNDSIQCTGTQAPELLAQCQTAMPCEAARLVRNRDTDFPIGDKAFINSTVAVTANSSGTLFASYRELARHAIHALRDVILDKENAFELALQKQSANPMKLVATD